MKLTNPAEYSLTELFEALESVDGQSYPERKAELEAELEKRRKSGQLAALEHERLEKEFASLHMSNSGVLFNSLGAGLLILVGVSLLTVVGHSYFVELPPGEVRKNPLAPVMFAILSLLYAFVIIRRIRFLLSLRPANDD